MKKKTACILMKISCLLLIGFSAKAQAQLSIEYASTPESPQLELVETEDNKFTRLQFKNDADLDNKFVIAAKVVDSDYRFGMFLNGSRRMLFEETDSTWTINSKMKFEGKNQELRMQNNAGTETIWFDPDDSQSAGRIHLSKADGSSSLKMDSDWNGTGLARVVTDEIELSGGSDFSEQFDINLEEDAKAEPGYIVSIDPNDSGKLKICTEAYDKKVVGIISGANGIRPGMLMGQKGSIADGEYPIALTGRVYVKASEQNGEINPGDLLTTSDEAGYAMKATDNMKSFGSIIGKAMTGIDENGFVLVLVNLQ